MVSRTVAPNTTTEASKTPVPKGMEWLVNTPQDKKYCLALAEACRGNDGLANIISYFLYEAAREVQGSMPQGDVEYVEIQRSHKDILLSLAKFNKSISEKTLIRRIVKLQSWQFLQSDGYHQTYRIFFRRIEEAMKNPLQPEKAKPRGIHARKCAQQDSACPEDCKSTISSKMTVSHQEDKKMIVLLEQELVNLQSQMVNLQFEMVKIQDQMVNLQSSESHERACRAALEAKIEALYNSNILSNTESNTLSFAPTGQNVEPLASSDDFATQHEATSFFETSLFPDLPPSQEEPKTSSPKSKKDKEENTQEDATAELRRAMYDSIVKKRGRKFLDGKVAMERKAIVKLVAQGFTVERVERIHDYLATEHWRYSQLENKYNISAQTILSESGAVEAILKDPTYHTNKQSQAKSQLPTRTLLPATPANSNIIKSNSSITDLQDLSRMAQARKAALVNG